MLGAAWRQVFAFPLLPKGGKGALTTWLREVRAAGVNPAPKIETGAVRIAIYHASTKPLSRSTGRSAVAAAAYRAGEVLVDERTGLVHDYSRRSGVARTDIVLPDGGSVERNALWNAAERAENRKDARTAREWVLALPDELDAEQRAELARDFAGQLASRYGVAVDVAIHLPDRDGDQRNHHAHVLTTTRQASRGVDGALLMGEKATIELSDKKRRELGLSAAADEVTVLRKLWEDTANGALARAGHDARIDSRSLVKQGIDRLPTTHLGPVATTMEREGCASDRGDLNRAADAKSAELARLKAEVIELEAVRRESADQVLAEADLKAFKQLSEAERRAVVARALQEVRERREAQKSAQAAPPASAFVPASSPVADLLSPQDREALRKLSEQERRALISQAFAQARAKRPVVREDAPEPQVLAPQPAPAKPRRKSCVELEAEIRRLRPAPVAELVEQDTAVLAASKSVRSLAKRHQAALAAERKAKAEAQAWAEQHPWRAWLHRQDLVRADYLVNRREAQKGAQAAWEALAPNIEEAQLQECNARRAATERIDAEQAIVRHQAAELEEQLRRERQREEYEAEQREQLEQLEQERTRNIDQAQARDNGPELDF